MHNCHLLLHDDNPLLNANFLLQGHRDRPIVEQEGVLNKPRAGGDYSGVQASAYPHRAFGAAAGRPRDDQAEDIVLVKVSCQGSKLAASQASRNPNRPPNPSLLFAARMCDRVTRRRELEITSP